MLYVESPLLFLKKKEEGRTGTEEVFYSRQATLAKKRGCGYTAGVCRIVELSSIRGAWFGQHSLARVLLRRRQSPFLVRLALGSLTVVLRLFCPAITVVTVI